MNDFREAVNQSSNSQNELLPMTEFQNWFMDVFGLLFNSIIIFCITWIFAYFFPDSKPFYIVSFGIFIGFVVPIIPLLIVAIFDHSLTIISDLYPDSSTRFYILLFINLLILTISSIWGTSEGLNSLYYCEKDEKSYYLFGVSKKIWLLLLIAYNPVVIFLTKFTIRSLVRFTDIISSKDFWENIFSFSNWLSGSSNSGLLGLLLQIFSILIIWGLSIALFSYGLKAIEKRNSNYRILRIIIVFVVIPLMIVLIPIIRNRDWFF
jgi:hypothetical protein